MNIYKNNRGNWQMDFVTPKGKESTMELMINTDRQWAQIEWEEDGDVNHIGLYFEQGELVYYDGYWVIPVEAIKLIRKAGFKATDEDWVM